MNHNSINILFLFWGRKGGGAKYSFEIAKELSNRKDVNLHLSISKQCDLISRFKSLSQPGLYIDTYNSVPGFINKWVFQRHQYFTKLRTYLEENQIDVLIIGMDFFWGSIFYKAAKLTGVKTIYVVHEPKPHPKEPFFMGLLKRWTLKRLITGADHLVTLTKHVKEFVLEQYNIEASKVSVIPHGIFSYYEASKPKKIFKKKNEYVRILYFGTITYYKGLDILLKAFKLLEEKYDFIKLEIWGSGDITSYQNLISDLDNVRIENRWIDESEIKNIFEETHICVLPYRDVSQSGIVGVASKAAMPIVASPAEGLKEQLAGTSVLFADDFSPESLAESIERLLIDPEYYSELSTEILQYAEKCSWHSIASRFKRICDELIQSNFR